ncbi:MAG: hypothetical protein B6D62_03700 [Candidatus Cloacimonas sp. 4484_275]|nr:MAG: hypothetical protein B6D62_03700 [Candidatus Cloacimonas sp. 4484_275]
MCFLQQNKTFRGIIIRMGGRVKMKKIFIIIFFVMICYLNVVADLNEGLVAYYPFGGDANDNTGNGNDGTIYGPISATDRFGNENQAYYLDGIDDYIEFPKRLYDYGIRDSFTVSIWIKSSNSPVMQMLLEDGTNWDNDGFYLGILPQLNQVFLRLNTNIESYFCDSLAVPNYAEEWTMFSYVYNGSEIKLYLNDYQAFSHSIQGTVLRGDRNLRIGYPSDESFYNGFVDDLRIYDRALSNDEIQILYYGLKANFSSPENAFVGEVIQFIDTSSGEPTSWNWDFENDGIYDSFLQNPTHIYNSEGTYSVKLKVSNETTIDSLIKDEIVTIYCQPASPDTMQININYPNALISWSAVDTTICGYPLTPDGYVVLYNEKYNQDEEDFYFLNFTTELSYIHTYVAEFRDQMFYKIVTIKNFNNRQTDYLKKLNNSAQKIKWTIIKENLKKLRSIGSSPK